MSKPVCYMMVGLPGSGKTTWAHDNFTDIPIVSTDYWVQQLAQVRGLTYAEAFDTVIAEATRLFDQEITELVQQKQSFVWDQTNITAHGRRGKLMRLPGYRVVAHAWLLPDAELQRRQNSRVDKVIPDTVLQDMMIKYSIPTPDQGFDEVIVHRE